MRFVWSIVLAIALGHIFVWLANSDLYHLWLQSKGITSQTSQSQWFNAFHKRGRFIVLHLNGERRLRGFPDEWADNSTEGHFRISEAAWLLDDGTVAELVATYSMLIPVETVEMVEFNKVEGEVTEACQLAQLAKTEKILLKEQKNERKRKGRKQKRKNRLKKIASDVY